MAKQELTAKKRREIQQHYDQLQTQGDKGGEVIAALEKLFNKPIITAWILHQSRQPSKGGI